MKYKTLLEAVRHPDVRIITQAQGWDVYRILSWEGAQQFVALDSNIPAGEKWSRSESTFNTQIRDGQYKLYFITGADLTQVTWGVITSTSGRMEVEDAGGHPVAIDNIPEALRTAIRRDSEAVGTGAEEPAEVPEATTPETAAASTDWASHKLRWVDGHIQSEDTGEIVKTAEDNWRTPVVKYKKIKDHIRITGLRDGTGDLRIPDTIEGLPVTELASYSILTEPNYNRIYFPNTIKKYSSGAFPPTDTNRNRYRRCVYHVARDAVVHGSSLRGSVQIRRDQ